uniref:Uncharacterized protein n=1 Tax=Aromatoleum buckelii TaxID=200254 RepID=A0ABX1N7B7_9RHOO
MTALLTASSAQRQLSGKCDFRFGSRLCENTVNHPASVLSMHKAWFEVGDEAIHRREESGADGVDARITG